MSIFNHLYQTHLSRKWIELSFIGLQIIILQKDAAGWGQVPQACTRAAKDLVLHLGQLYGCLWTANRPKMLRVPSVLRKMRPRTIYCVLMCSCVKYGISSSIRLDCKPQFRNKTRTSRIGGSKNIRHCPKRLGAPSTPKFSFPPGISRTSSIAGCSTGFRRSFCNSPFHVEFVERAELSDSTGFRRSFCRCLGYCWLHKLLVAGRQKRHLALRARTLLVHIMTQFPSLVRPCDSHHPTVMCVRVYPHAQWHLYWASNHFLTP